MVGAPAPRNVAVDVARCLALLGILVNHLVGGPVSDALRDVHAVLFAVLVGVGAELARSRRGGGAVAAGATRAAALALVGLSLAELDTRAAVVLVNLAVVALAATWAARRSTRTVLVVAALVAAASPVVAWRVRAAIPTRLPDVGWTDLGAPVNATATLVAATPYPVALWVVHGLVGVLAARHGLARGGQPDRPGGLAVAGLSLAVAGRVAGIVALAVTGRTALLDVEPRARALPDDASRLALIGAYLPTGPSLAVSAGCALVVLAAVVALCRVPAIATHPITCAAAVLGSTTLSAYTLHVLLLPATELALAAWPALTPWTWWLTHVAILTTLLLCWHRWATPAWRAGPLEAPTAALVRVVTDRVTRRSGPSPAPPPADRRA